MTPVSYLNELGDFFVKYGGWGAAIVIGLYLLKKDRENRKYKGKVAETFESYHKELVGIHLEDTKGDNRIANKLASLNKAFNDLVDYLRYSGMKIEIKKQEESATIILENGETLE